MKVAFVGYGNVGATLAAATLGGGHDVVLARLPDRPDGADAARAARPGLAAASVAPVEEAVAGADVVVLAVPFGTLDAVVPPIAPLLAGTVVVDATNPVGPGLTHGLGSRSSGAEHVAALAPGARVVKAFSVYGFENLQSPPAGPAGMRPVMPLAGTTPPPSAPSGGSRPTSAGSRCPSAASPPRSTWSTRPCCGSASSAAAASPRASSGPRCATSPPDPLRPWSTV